MRLEGNNEVAQVAPIVVPKKEMSMLAIVGTVEVRRGHPVHLKDRPSIIPLKATMTTEERAGQSKVGRIRTTRRKYRAGYSLMFCADW